MQGAVAAGLLGVGGVFVGTVEGCAKLLARIVAAADRAAPRRAIVAEHKAAGSPLPGLRPRRSTSPTIRARRVCSRSRARTASPARTSPRSSCSAPSLDAAKRRHITINATGAVAAVLADAGVPAEIMRGFALVARCAGLVGHVHEEQHDPAMRAMWHAAERAVPYDPRREPK